MVAAKFFRYFEIILYSIVFAGMSGCAYTYMDTKGAEHIVGLVNMKIDLEGKEGQNGGHSVQMTSVGMSIYSNPMNRGFVLGYNRELILSLSENSCLFFKHGNP